MSFLRRVTRTRSSLPVAWVLAVFAMARAAFAVSCPVMQAQPQSDADKALMAAHFSEAEGLYRTALVGHPDDVHLITGLVHALLRQQKVQEAADMASSAAAAAPQNPALITLRGEAELRQGMPWDAAANAEASNKIDPCNARTMLLLSKVAHLSSLYATWQRLIVEAHQIDPHDPEIRKVWLTTLPLKERIAELESYLQQPTGEDEEDIRHLHMALDRWKKLRDEPRKPCRMVSTAAATELPMIKLMYDAHRVRAFGLDVKLNNRDARLEIDTGAGGLVVKRGVADRAGLHAFSENEMNGVGDEGSKRGYTAYADSIRIGGLEFQNCAVKVLDSKQGLEDVDGLIGMDVLSHFLVTLDYPMHKIMLGPLPPRPGEAPSIKPELKTGDSSPEEAEDEANATKQPDQAAAPANAEHEKLHAETPAVKAPHGPWDRYVAPEMKDYAKVYRIGHALILPASLNASKIRLFIMETGAWATTISPQAAREVTKVHNDDSARQVRGISGKVEKLYTADDVTFQFANVRQNVNGVTAFDTSRISKSLGMDISGLLGATTLEQMTIHIDYRDGLVKFEYDPNRGYRF